MRRPFVCLLALVAAVAVACGSLQSYAAIVNGHRIPQNEVDDELKAIRGNGRYLDAIDPSRRQILGSGSNTFNASFTAQILSRSIYYQLVHDEVVRRHLKVTQQDLDAAKAQQIRQLQGEEVFNGFPASYRHTLERRAAEVAVLGRSFTESGDEDAKARAYYDAHKADFEQACASHILLEDKGKADAIEARLAKGEDFAAVAKSDSKDPGSAQKGGELGCFGRDAQLVPEFLQAIFAQPVGQVGPPVQSQFGFHVIKVTARHVPTFDEAKPQVLAAINAGSEQKLSEWLLNAVKTAKVKVNPKFGKFDKNQQTPGVVPPQAPPSRTSTSVPGLPGGVGQPGGAGQSGGAGSQPSGE